MVTIEDFEKLQFLGKNNNIGLLLALFLSTLIGGLSALYLYSGKQPKLSSLLLLYSMFSILLFSRNMLQYRKTGLFYTFFYDMELKKVLLMKNCLFGNKYDIKIKRKKYKLVSEFDIDHFILEKKYLIKNLTMLHSKKKYLFVNIEKSPIKKWLIENIGITTVAK
jgi:hypothetical protein